VGKDACQEKLSCNAVIGKPNAGLRSLETYNTNLGLKEDPHTAKDGGRIKITGEGTGGGFLRNALL